VGSDNEVDLARGKRAADARGFVTGKRCGEARDPQSTRISRRVRECAQRRFVLLGEQFGRRHQRALAIALGDGHRCEVGDDCLSTTDVSLEQAVHRMRAREIREDLAERAFLRTRQREWKRSHGGRGALFAGDWRAWLRGPLSTTQRQAQLEQIEFLEHEARPRWCRARGELAGIDIERRLVEIAQRLPGVG